VLSRFDTVPERDGQTDGQIESLYQYRASVSTAMLMRDKTDWYEATGHFNVVKGSVRR